MDSTGFIIHAHPFREEEYLDSVILVPSLVDAVEVVHGGKCSEDKYIKRASWYADEFNLFKTGGSDTHTFDRKLTGIAVEHRAESIMDLITQIKTNKSRVLEAIQS